MNEVLHSQALARHLKSEPQPPHAEVKHVMVAGVPIQPDATYKVAITDTMGKGPSNTP